MTSRLFQHFSLGLKDGSDKLTSYLNGRFDELWGAHSKFHWLTPFPFPFRGNDGSDRHGQQPDGWRFCGGGGCHIPGHVIRSFGFSESRSPKFRRAVFCADAAHFGDKSLIRAYWRSFAMQNIYLVRLYENGRYSLKRFA